MAKHLRRVRSVTVFVNSVPILATVRSVQQIYRVDHIYRVDRVRFLSVYRQLFSWLQLAHHAE